MKSRYPVRWRRRSGETVAIEQMSDIELAAARHILEREDAIDPIAALLFDAVTEELRGRSAAPATPGEIEHEQRREAA